MRSLKDMTVLGRHDVYFEVPQATVFFVLKSFQQ